MKYLTVIILIIVAFFIFKKDTWLGFYYPDGCLGCSENYIYSPEFDTKEQCFDWADSLRMSRGNNQEDLFECGLNCKAKGEGMYFCKQTVDE